MTRTLPVDPEVLPPPLPHELAGWGRLKRIVGKFPVANLEVLGGFGLLWVGLWFMWPWNTFPTGGVLHAVYDGHTWLWGPIFFLLGVYKFWVVLYAYETRHRSVVSFLVLLSIWQIFLAYLRVAEHEWEVMGSLLAMTHQLWIVARNRSAWRYRWRR
jgi:hypothetical protein